MSDKVRLEFDGQDAECLIDETGSGIVISMRYGECCLTMTIDFDSAWQLSDALARVTSRAAVARARAAREVAP